MAHIWPVKRHNTARQVVDTLHRSCVNTSTQCLHGGSHWGQKPLQKPPTRLLQLEMEETIAAPTESELTFTRPLEIDHGRHAIRHGPFNM
jgi:hypothetical protein